MGKEQPPANNHNATLLDSWKEPYPEKPASTGLAAFMIMPRVPFRGITATLVAVTLCLRLAAAQKLQMAGYAEIIWLWFFQLSKDGISTHRISLFCKVYRCREWKDGIRWAAAPWSGPLWKGRALKVLLRDDESLIGRLQSFRIFWKLRCRRGRSLEKSYMKL